MDDATLVSRAVGGDRDAFADVYDRYAGAVFDLCTAILRDAEAAGEATLDSFLRAARELVNLRDRSQLRLWLLAVARHEATARAQGEGRRLPTSVGRGIDAEPADGAGGSTPPAEGDGSAAAAADAPPPEWDPSEALSEQDRAILHLHLRHQLGAEELGVVLGVRAAVAEARATRLRTRAESSVGALLLTRADGGADGWSCPGLTEVLEGWDGRFTPALGARVDRHARRCDACRERRTVLLARLTAMASLPFLPPPPWLRREVLLRMELAVSPRPLPGWAEDGFPPGIDGPARRSRRRPTGRAAAAVLAAAVVVALVAGGYVVFGRDGDGRSTVSASGRPAVSSTVRSPATGVTAALTAPATTPTTVAATSTVPTTIVPTSLAPTTSAPPGPVVVVDRDPPAISFGADAASAYAYGCPYSVTGVSADVTDQSLVTRVALFVQSPDGAVLSVVMTPEGGRWRAAMGDFATPGQAVYWVEADDSEGNHARAGDQTFQVLPCG